MAVNNAGIAGPSAPVGEYPLYGWLHVIAVHLDGLDHAADGIRVNAVGPGFINTPLLASAPPEVIAGVAALHPRGQLGTAREVAELVCFLASAAASITTGGYYLTDGGYTAR